MGNEGVWFRLGECELHVGVSRAFSPATKAHPALRLASAVELEGLARRLEEAGLQLDWDDRLPGARRFYALDPWGNRLEFLAR